MHVVKIVKPGCKAIFQFWSKVIRKFISHLFGHKIIVGQIETTDAVFDRNEVLGGGETEAGHRFRPLVDLTNQWVKVVDKAKILCYTIVR